MSDEATSAETIETLTRKLEGARARIASLAEQVAVAERVQAGLRSRIAQLEHDMELANQPVVLPADPPIDLSRHVAPTASATTAAVATAAVGAAVNGDFHFGENEDDLLPRSS